MVSMDEWVVAYTEDDGPAFVEFGADQMGDFQFGLRSGNNDYCIPERAEQPTVKQRSRRAKGRQGRGWELNHTKSKLGMIRLPTPGIVVTNGALALWREVTDKL